MIHRDVKSIDKYWGLDASNPKESYPATVSSARVVAQAYKDTSSDGRKNFASLFAYGKRSGERDAYQQAHMTPSGTPGIVKLAVLDNHDRPMPFAPFEWNGRQMLTDANGTIKYVERDYFQTAISLENERVKYVTQMIALVVGQPTENVIALFGYEFYTALAGSESVDSENALFATALYNSYLITAGIDDSVRKRKCAVFKRYSDAECSPEVMCNYGDNDPEWSRAFNKLSLLIEFHPSAILFDSGHLDPLESAGRIHGDKGTHNVGPMTTDDMARAGGAPGAPRDRTKFHDGNHVPGNVTGQSNKQFLTGGTGLGVPATSAPSTSA